MMFFTITAGNETIYDPTLIQNGRGLISPKLTLELGKAGSLQFTMPPDNVGYNSITKLSTIVRVYRNNSLIFKGRVLDIERDFYNRKRVYCEGALSFLTDTNMRPFGTVTMGVRDFLSLVVDAHNAYVESSKRFTVGTVSVSGAGAIERTSIDYTTTLDLLTSELTDKYGGYFRAREIGGVNYIDYLTAYDQIATQQIEFGKNLLDITEYVTAEDVFTVLIPLGAQEKDSEGNVTGRVNISSVNGNKEYLDNTSGISLFGRIEKVQIWDDITEPSALLTNAQTVLSSGVDSNIKLTISAVDLNLVSNDIDSFELGDIVRVVSEPHNVDTLFQIIKIDLDITSPDQTTYEFSADYDGIQPTVQTQSIKPGQIRLMDATLTAANGETGHYALSKSTKTGSTTLTEKTMSGQKDADKTSATVARINTETGTESISGSRLVNGSVTNEKIATNAVRTVQIQNSSVTTPKLADYAVNEDKLADNAVSTDIIQNSSITPAKIQETSDTSWLTKINTMLSKATSSTPVAFGGGSGYVTTNYVTFSADAGGWMRIYFSPISVRASSNNTQYSALVVIKTATDVYYALCTGTTGVITINAIT